MIRVRLIYRMLLPQEAPTQIDCAGLRYTENGTVMFYDAEGNNINGMNHSCLMALEAREIPAGEAEDAVEVVQKLIRALPDSDTVTSFGHAWNELSIEAQETVKAARANANRWLRELAAKIARKESDG